MPAGFVKIGLIVRSWFGYDYSIISKSRQILSDIDAPVHWALHRTA
jgi:hypothetical protein